MKGCSQSGASGRTNIARRWEKEGVARSQAVKAPNPTTEFTASGFVVEENKAQEEEEEEEEEIEELEEPALLGGAEERSQGV
ncbi:hypothetical protein E2C01_084954 [Portunus trituberculatus]|uniref:Uncharacterized protein n=1 Tax=Portunus trituberculatus TaxID=210409 RepID=A0A5B7JAN2_PORTR|nr:hypothetical protein [Portunus trituberculatus]